MTVDNEFTNRVADSRFSNQEWGLIMTATELKIENADDPENARIVADTQNVQHIMPELEKVRSQMPQMGGGSTNNGASGGGGGIIDSLKGILGLGGSSNEKHIAAAEQLTQEYAEELQRHLESENMWEQVRIAYQE
jgi:hypothetical protein